MKIGDKLKGHVTGIQSYGAFITLENGTTGLVHISEIRTGYISSIDQILAMGQEVEVQVIEVDEFSGKLSLSMRSLEEEKRRAVRKKRFTSNKQKIGFAPLKDALPHWTAETLKLLREEERS